VAPGGLGLHSEQHGLGKEVEPLLQGRVVWGRVGPHAKHIGRPRFGDATARARNRPAGRGGAPQRDSENRTRSGGRPGPSAITSNEERARARSRWSGRGPMPIPSGGPRPRRAGPRSTKTALAGARGSRGRTVQALAGATPLISAVSALGRDGAGGPGPHPAPGAGSSTRFPRQKKPDSGIPAHVLAGTGSPGFVCTICRGLRNGASRRGTSPPTRRQGRQLSRRVQESELCGCLPYSKGRPFRPQKKLGGSLAILKRRFLRRPGLAARGRSTSRSIASTRRGGPRVGKRPRRGTSLPRSSARIPLPV